MIKGYLSNTKELSDINNKLHELVCLQAKKYSVEEPQKSTKDINDTVIKLDSINSNIGAFLNDTLNASPELFKLLNSERIENLSKYVFENKDSIVAINNHRLRIQIPGHDDISNLPWHQDSHYNNFYQLKQFYCNMGIDQ